MISLDTNILVYAFDPSDAHKHEVASALLQQAIRSGSSIAAQVYGEFYVACVRKQIATRSLASNVLVAWSALMRPIASSNEAHTTAREFATEHQLQYWDALIIATCAEHGIAELFTEDVPGVKKPLGVKCTNPFK
jgi:predicted nucleic acid-binding protein